jgi:hypothetical protein
VAPQKINRLAGIWPNSTVVLIAGGPSLTPDQVEYLRPRHAFGDIKVAGVNDAYRICNFLDLLYGADARWWDAHPDAARVAMRATYVDPREPPGPHLAKYDLLGIPGEYGAGISTDPRRIHLGYNSGFQLLNIAVQAGARRILLLGYDCQRGEDGRRHWFGDHPEPMNLDSPYGRFAYEADFAAASIKAAGVEVINCSTRTALVNYPRQPITEALE